MFKFDRNDGWSPIADFFLATGKNDTKQERVAAGYVPFPAVAFGSEYGGFEVEVVAASSGSAPYPFVVTIGVNGSFEDVAVPSLPDLIELLAKIGPIAEAASQAEDRKERERLEDESSGAHSK